MVVLLCLYDAVMLFNSIYTSCVDDIIIIVLHDFVMFYKNCIMRYDDMIVVIRLYCAVIRIIIVALLLAY